MVIRKAANISVRKQCDLLDINRSTLYYSPKGESKLNLMLMKLIDQEYLKHPFYGSRKMAYFLRSQGHQVSRHRVRCLMRLMGLCAIYQKPHTSQRNLEHKIYPYLLNDLKIERSNQV